MGQELNKTTFMKLSYFLSFCFLLLAVASWAQPDLENLSREEKTPCANVLCTKRR